MSHLHLMLRPAWSMPRILHLHLRLVSGQISIAPAEDGVVARLLAGQARQFRRRFLWWIRRHVMASIGRGLWHCPRPRLRVDSRWRFWHGWRRHHHGRSRLVGMHVGMHVVMQWPREVGTLGPLGRFAGLLMAPNDRTLLDSGWEEGSEASWGRGKMGGKMWHDRRWQLSRGEEGGALGSLAGSVAVEGWEGKVVHGREGSPTRRLVDCWLLRLVSAATTFLDGVGSHKLDIVLGASLGRGSRSRSRRWLHVGKPTLVQERRRHGHFTLLRLSRSPQVQNPQVKLGSP